MTWWARVKRYVYNCARAFDVWANTWAGGSPDETLSRRAERARIRGRWWGRALCRALDWLDPGHCPETHPPSLVHPGAAGDSDELEELTGGRGR